jgi:molybdenum cofactor biosynthesis enzyme MoaA
MRALDKSSDNKDSSSPKSLKFLESQFEKFQTIISTIVNYMKVDFLTLKLDEVLIKQTSMIKDVLDSLNES